MKKLVLVTGLILAMVTMVLAQKCVVVRDTMACEDHSVIETYVTALILSVNAGNKGFFNDVEAELLDAGQIIPVDKGVRVDIIKLNKIIIMGIESTTAQVRIHGRLWCINTVELDCK